MPIGLYETRNTAAIKYIINEIGKRDIAIAVSFGIAIRLDFL
jgi:hypothetical protein